MTKELGVVRSHCKPRGMEGKAGLFPPACSPSPVSSWPQKQAPVFRSSSQVWVRSKSPASSEMCSPLHSQGCGCSPPSPRAPACLPRPATFSGGSCQPPGWPWGPSQGIKWQCGPHPGSPPHPTFPGPGDTQSTAAVVCSRQDAGLQEGSGVDEAGSSDPGLVIQRAESLGFGGEGVALRAGVGEREILPEVKSYMGHGESIQVFL